MRTSFSGLVCLMLCGVLGAAPAASAMPPGLATALVEARYAIEGQGEDYLARNPRNRQHIAFRDGGFEVSALAAPDAEPATKAVPDWTWGLRLHGYGTPQAIQPVGEPQCKVAGTRLEYRRGSLTEWYENRPAGLEQGFTLHTPPAPEADELVLVLALLGDLQADWETPGQALRFRTAAGEQALSYRDLKVVDAAGAHLPAHLALGPEQLEIHVDARGATWPIVVDPLIAGPQAKLTASDGAAGEHFGLSVALSGDTALIGTYDGARAFVFTRIGATWSQQAKLYSPDFAGNWFGKSVAVAGDTALIGAARDSDAAGAAYVFVRTGETWTYEAKLTAADSAVADWFGNSVALSDGTALIGAPGDDDRGVDAGAVYVFARNGRSWIQQAKLTAADGVDFAEFGGPIALSGDTALIGVRNDAENGNAAGAAYVFTRTGSTWSQQAKLIAADGDDGDNFGKSVALFGDTALIGATGANANAAYVFTRIGGVWRQQAKLTAADAVVGDVFGFSVALAADTALISSSAGQDWNPGAVYVFTRNGNDWTQQAKLLPPDSPPSDAIGFFINFGIDVALSGKTALIGAFQDDDKGENAGAAYVFDLGDLGSTFADVPSTHWAFAYINAIYEAGLTTGCGGGNYCPEAVVTREQMAAFLVRALEGEPPAGYCGGAAPFGDVAPGSWACGYIKRLVELGVTSGCGGGNYCPVAAVTREQMAAFLVRALEGEPPAGYCGGTAPFSDVAPGSWACGYIKRLAELGITTGCAAGLYCPLSDVQRDQMAAFLARAFLGL